MEEESAGGGGGGGTPADPPDDRKGVDIVHGAKRDIQTRRNKRGQIYAKTEDGWERVEDTRNGRHGLTREEMKQVEDHWTKDETSDNNTEVKETSPAEKSEATPKVVEKDASKVVEKTNENPMPGNKNEDNRKTKTAENIDTAKEGTEPVGIVPNILKDATEHEIKRTEKKLIERTKIKNKVQADTGKVPPRLQKQLTKLAGELK